MVYLHDVLAVRVDLRHAVRRHSLVLDPRALRLAHRAEGRRDDEACAISITQHEDNVYASMWVFALVSKVHRVRCTMPCYPRGAERRTGLVREVDRADLDDRAARRQPERGRDLLEDVSVDPLVP